MTNINICDEYVRRGSQLIGNNLKLILTTRRTTSPNKPADFLLLVNPKTKKREFISSLYFQKCVDDLCKYKFDYKGHLYFIYISPDYAKVYKINRA